LSLALITVFIEAIPIAGIAAMKEGHGYGWRLRLAARPGL